MSPGQRLGRFEVGVVLGRGGMGEVWRATDSSLGREVALKVLPEELADDPERLARFDREARLLAALNHGNIATLYGLERIDGRHLLVMELVAGEGLDERIARGPVPVDEAVDIALGIAEALEAAHDAGIVHRDLKPANVRLRPDGTVKVLDFGLAKAWELDGTSGDVSLSPTLTGHATAAGVILGTAGYMAPEQARGRPADRRADVWAFGVVLWEMLTGRRLFDGETVTDVLAAVLREEPDLDGLPPATPPAMRRLLERCLTRDPKLRLQAIGEARIALAEPSVARPGETAVPAAARPRTSGRAVWGVVALLLVALAVLGWRLASQPPERGRVIRSVLPLPEGVSMELDGERTGMPALSPDGRRLAFGAREGAGPMRIWVYDLAEGSSRPLPGTEGGYRPFWSPDGEWLGFFTWGSLVKTPAGGGAVTVLALARDSRGGTWSPSGTIVYAPYPWGPLLAIPDSGGEPRQVTRSSEDRSFGTDRYPQFLPDGEHFVYLHRPGRLARGDEAGVRVGRLGSTEDVVRISDAVTNAVYAAGHLLVVRDRTLLAQPFDPGRLELGGPATPIVGDLLFNDRFSYGVFAAHDDQVLVFLTGEQSDLSRLVWRDRSGARLGELGTPGDISGFGGLSLSPDGRWAAVSRIDDNGTDTNVWIYDLDRGTETRLARPGSDEYDPIFSPDSSAVVFGSDTEERSSIIRRDLGRGTEEQLISDDAATALAPMSFSPDGREMTVDLRHSSLQTDVLVVAADGGDTPTELLATPGDETFGQISPDGRWLVWSSDDSGRYEVYVAPYPELGARVRVSRSGGTQPRWSSRGGEVFYKAPDNMLTAVPIETASGTASVGEPEPLFQVVEFYGWTYAVSADGQRFLVREPLGEAGASPLTLLTDWTRLAARR